MSIDEAIAHARAEAELQRKYAKEIRKRTIEAHLDYGEAEEQCAEYHEQIVEWLEELKEYQAIGTPEECRAAVEKQKAKKPIEPDEEYGTFKCPNCGGLIFTEDRFETHKHCLLCGQKLDWRDEE